ncbi:MAG TPA: SagB/ThcOx family dehydrogenase, partial [Firmicutes bacterium]|nr:SagB/ThcOx family dehydrogenase [Bacillota bacterium]
LAVQNVQGLKPGLYRYLALEHQLLLLYHDDRLAVKMIRGTRGQDFVGTAAVTFIWSCVPYRGEWRYADRSHKVMLIDAGHVCHALYIACTALGLGNCAVGAYDQKLMDQLIEVDGEDEFTVYLSPVGKI